MAGRNLKTIPFKRLTARIAGFVFLQIHTATLGWGVMHYPDKQASKLYPHPAQDQVSVRNARQLQLFRSLGARTVSPASGNKKVAVILVQFPSASASFTTDSTKTSIQNLSNVDAYFTQMAAYYNEVSYGKMTLSFTFFGATASSSLAASAGVYTLDNPMEYYGCGDEGLGCSGVTTPTPGQIRANGDYLIRDALVKARVAHPDLSTINYAAVIVVHAGYGNETTLKNGDVWSIFYSQDSIITDGGGGFDQGDVVPELESSGITSPLGVMCHEFGHELGLPDQYNTLSAGGTSVVGDWELMDSGPFDGNGANPSHMGAWDKYTLGWAAPQVITTKGTYKLGYTALTASAEARIPVQNGLSQEYFLIENRSRTSGATYDAKIPGDGLLVWHIDDAITASRGVTVTDASLANTVNTGSPHYGISIVTRDGLTISNSNRGDSGNPFIDNEKIFTSPLSDNFSGAASGVSMLDISGAGTSNATMYITNLAVAASQNILKMINYPNPAGKGYPHAKGAGYTTIQFQLARPAQDYQINIYTLSGDLVRKVSQSDINFNGPRSDDLKWVYEYDWDLTNGDGAIVGPGVYLYLMRADGKTQSGKMVVIR